MPCLDVGPPREADGRWLAQLRDSDVHLPVGFMMTGHAIAGRPRDSAPPPSRLVARTLRCDSLHAVAPVRASVAFTPLGPLLLGALAGVVSKVAVMPLDVAKKRMQATHSIQSADRNAPVPIWSPMSAPGRSPLCGGRGGRESSKKLSSRLREMPCLVQGVV